MHPVADAPAGELLCQTDKMSGRVDGKALACICAANVEERRTPAYGTLGMITVLTAIHRSNWYIPA